MHFPSISSALIVLALGEAASVSANHYKPRMNEVLPARSSAFSAHLHRPRDDYHRRGSLRKRCTRKSSSQIALSGDSEDDQDDSSSSSSSSSTTSDSRTNTSSTTTKVSTGNSTAHTGSWLKKNCVTWGWITDDGDHSHGSTGSLETPAQINSAVGTDALYFGAYAHIQGDEYKKGEQ